MTQPATAETEPTRLVLFVVGSTGYAIPIADVVEVVETSRTAGIPTLPRGVASVMNHHGDALPVVAREALFEAAGELAEPEHVLVLATARGETGRLGLPVDRVLGLADVALAPATGRDLVALRIPLRGRVVGVLHAQRAIERATRVVQESHERGVPRSDIEGGRT